MTDQQEEFLHTKTSELVKVWCEYDINGSFGGNNNEEVCRIMFPSDMPPDDYSAHISIMVMKHMKEQTGLDEDDLDGLIGWDYFTPLEL
ncbi:hypothetical protein FDI46_gp221 [Aeromonas phage AS-gz]|uniref:Uncharacterized protein n=4 Tax=Tulanevirus TaxID=2560244 RepID=A0A898KAB0_9CAUD|nr:hypothetical protein FDI46_gp221 [Aeromonas phage AS-gz]YP_010095764.1 hypothetical protein KNT91_gp036 [Aeromonas phage 60AhydR15PP]QSJ03517.1 hypothetical protein [Aeromonas phage vB_AsM_ZHF]UIW13068.1 hypothetical protein Ah13A_132 [Aeromonas phage AhMtk13a]UYD57971.1 hypothetical protein GHHBBDOD_00100 [Aeromonas phage avDM4]ASU00757.1 hypothetical protein [Aeromonas phage AS-gz]AWH15560.1 hypothetical protein [Aeromonas phage 60AhydR15PP]